MTWRLALDRRRGDRRRETREVAHAESVPWTAAADSVDASYRSRELWRAIDALPDKLRIALVLASIEGHDLAEVASLLRLAGTVIDCSAKTLDGGRYRLDMALTDNEVLADDANSCRGIGSCASGPTASVRVFAARHARPRRRRCARSNIWRVA